MPGFGLNISFGWGMPNPFIFGGGCCSSFNPGMYALGFLNGWQNSIFQNTFFPRNYMISDYTYPQDYIYDRMNSSVPDYSGMYEYRGNNVNWEYFAIRPDSALAGLMQRPHQGTTNPVLDDIIKRGQSLPELLASLEVPANAPKAEPDAELDEDEPPKEQQEEPAKDNKPARKPFNKSELGPEFLDKVKDMAKKLDCNYKDLLAIMNSESGLNPQAIYYDDKGGMGAVGIIQFTDKSIAQLNKVYNMLLTKEKILKMSVMEQLDLAEKYYLDAKNFKLKDKKLSGGDLYAITFTPSWADREILVKKGHSYYNGNRGLDEDKNGDISKTDLSNHLKKKWVDEKVFEAVA